MIRTVWVVGPESRVYHTNPNCLAISHSYRYWPVSQGILGPRGGVILRGRRIWGLRPCKRCNHRRKNT